MSGFGAPAFTAMPTFEIISSVLPLPATSPPVASSSTTSVLVMTTLITRRPFTRFNMPGNRRSGQTAGLAVDAAAVGGPQRLAEAFYAHRQPVKLKHRSRSVPMACERDGSGDTAHNPQNDPR